MDAAYIVGLGTDSFLACVAIGSLAISLRERIWLAAAFGAFDACATLISNAGVVLPEPLALTIYLVCAFLLGYAAKSRRSIVYLLPLLLSVDNVFSGGTPVFALLLGVSSGVMAMAGLVLGGACRRWVTGSHIAGFQWRNYGRRGHHTVV